MSSSLRDQMPFVTSVIDELREVFGVTEMNWVIVKGLKEPNGFLAKEGGVEIGFRDEREGVTLDQIVLRREEVERQPFRDDNNRRKEI